MSAITRRATAAPSAARSRWANPPPRCPRQRWRSARRSIVQSVRGTRRIAADEFYLGPYMTALEPDELLVGDRVPDWPADTITVFREVAQRPGDFALVGLVGALALDGGKIARAGIAWFGMGPTPIKARQAEAALLGQSLDRIDPRAIAELAIADTAPFDDHHATAEYRRTVGRRIFARDPARGARPEGGGMSEPPTSCASSSPSTAASTAAGSRRAPRSPISCAPRRLHRRACRLRARRLRRLHGDRRRQGGAHLPDARRCRRTAPRSPPSKVSPSPTARSTRSSRRCATSYALQCGFCTPGVVMTFAALTAGNAPVSEETLIAALSGHICRCTGYQGIRRAAQRLATASTGESAGAPA